MLSYSDPHPRRPSNCQHKGEDERSDTNEPPNWPKNRGATEARGTAVLVEKAKGTLPPSKLSAAVEEAREVSSRFKHASNVLSLRRRAKPRISDRSAASLFPVIFVLAFRAARSRCFALVRRRAVANIFIIPLAAQNIPGWSLARPAGTRETGSIVEKFIPSPPPRELFLFSVSRSHQRRGGGEEGVGARAAFGAGIPVEISRRKVFAAIVRCRLHGPARKKGGRER